jgi:hypothetical protein
MFTDTVGERHREYGPNDAESRDFPPDRQSVVAHAPSAAPIAAPSNGAPIEHDGGSLRALSDRELDFRLTRLTSQKHQLDAQLLLCLAEVDRRKLYLNSACSSLFELCVRRLGFSEDVAWRRVGAARMLRRFPLLFTFLSD